MRAAGSTLRCGRLGTCTHGLHVVSHSGVGVAQSTPPPSHALLCPVPLAPHYRRPSALLQPLCYCNRRFAASHTLSLCNVLLVPLNTHTHTFKYMQDCAAVSTQWSGRAAAGPQPAAASRTWLLLPTQLRGGSSSQAEARDGLQQAAGVLAGEYGPRVVDAVLDRWAAASGAVSEVWGRLFVTLNVSGFSRRIWEMFGLVPQNTVWVLGPISLIKFSYPLPLALPPKHPQRLGGAAA